MNTSRKELRIAEEPRPRKVTQVYMAVAESDAGEGVYTILGPNDERLPLVALDAGALSVLRTYAQSVANDTGKTVSIICFTDRRLYERFPPVTTGD